MKTWKYNDKVEIDLPEFTLEAFDKFTKQSTFGIFIHKDCIKDMRNKFKKDFKLEEK